MDRGRCCDGLVSAVDLEVDSTMVDVLNWSNSLDEVDFNSENFQKMRENRTFQAEIRRSFEKNSRKIIGLRIFNRFASFYARRHFKLSREECSEVQ